MGSSSSRGGRAEIPESMIIMTVAYLKLYQMHIPWRFSKKYIADSETRVILKIRDKTWDATLSRGKSSWPRHKVDLATTNVWSRLELKYSLPKHKNTSQRPTVGDDMSKEKYAELEKPVIVLKEAREKLSSNVAQMKKELEECQKKSWAILPSTKLLLLSLDTKDKYLAMRQPVPPGTFICRSQLGSPYTTHPEGGLTMLVFYNGNRSQILLDNDLGEGVDNVIPLPYSKDHE
ncbi:hypothetical protein LINPERHAP2_LOCUS35587, partial [Linum perenne]